MIVGALVAMAGIVGGVLLDGGELGLIFKPAAALIVLGGTAGAVLVSYPLRTVVATVKGILQLFTNRAPVHDDVINEVCAFASKAKKEGVRVLERHLRHASDPLLRQGLGMVVDGHDAKTIRGLLEVKLQCMEERLEQTPRVLEAAGGYAPTVGILGAVLGLVQVLPNLDSMGDVGTGIATAFVATLYGVGFANLFFLPVATKLRGRQREQLVQKEMIVEGVLSIQEGLNPHLIEDKLRSFHELEDAEAA